jgi:hypothetical protein
METVYKNTYSNKLYPTRFKIPYREIVTKRRLLITQKDIVKCDIHSLLPFLDRTQRRKHKTDARIGLCSHDFIYRFG